MLYGGYTIPYYTFVGNRSMLLENMVRREAADAAFTTSNPSADIHSERAEKGMRAYWVNTNMVSLDGLPGVEGAPFVGKVPKSAWTLEGFKREEREMKRRLGVGKEGEEATKQLTKQSLAALPLDARLVAAFSLGVLTTALFMKLGDIKVYM